jgi:hypothetical protein
MLPLYRASYKVRQSQTVEEWLGAAGATDQVLLFLSSLPFWQLCSQPCVTMARATATPFQHVPVHIYPQFKLPHMLSEGDKSLGNDTKAAVVTTKSKCSELRMNGCPLYSYMRSLYSCFRLGHVAQTDALKDKKIWVNALDTDLPVANLVTEAMFSMWSLLCDKKILTHNITFWVYVKCNSARPICILAAIFKFN